MRETSQSKVFKKLTNPFLLTNNIKITQEDTEQLS